MAYGRERLRQALSWHRHVCSTGGTIHIISDNQVGFTTDPSEARSTRYASDLAKGSMPIAHVNADDVDACIAAVHVAIDVWHPCFPQRPDKPAR